MITTEQVPTEWKTRYVSVTCDMCGAVESLEDEKTAKTSTYCFTPDHTRDLCPGCVLRIRLFIDNYDTTKTS